jgi:hypothetical protein
LTLSPLLLVWLSIKTLQVTESPNGEHQVRLSRLDGIDRNYKVTVDGRKVYSSPDFAPRSDLGFREALVWDATGQVVVLEIAGRRLFGYDVEKQKPLADDELLSLKLAPEPDLGEYMFEGEWPGLGRVRPKLHGANGEL